MAEFLSEDWCAELERRTGRAVPVLRDAVIGLQVTGAPRGRGRVTLVIEDGRLVSCEPRRAESPEIEMKAAFVDLAAMVRGELDPNVAFMTGDLKADGPTGPLLAVLAACRGEEFRIARDELASATDGI